MRLLVDPAVYLLWRWHTEIKTLAAATPAPAIQAASGEEA
jgi:hypothetical protein